MITVIGAGAGEAENLSLKALNILLNAKKIVLKTQKMPISDFLSAKNIEFSTLDYIYEQSDDFDFLNNEIAKALTSLKDCCYVVFGNALDDTSVAALDDCQIIPGISLADTVAASNNFTLPYVSVTANELLSSKNISLQTSNIITCIDSQLIAGDLKCFLADFYGDEYSITFSYQDALGAVKNHDIMLYQLDQQEFYNHTASIVIKKRPIITEGKNDFCDLIEITRRLCDKNGCPWDSKQTHESLRRYIIEEAFEVVDAIDKKDEFMLADELGDVLFQVAIHACIAEKFDEFSVFDITDSICKKMIHRHGHVFNNEEAKDWEALKQEEKAFSSLGEMLDDIPQSFSALMYAEKAQARAEKRGINVSLNGNDNTVLNENELGEILFKTVAVCRKNKISPEIALKKAAERFINYCKNKKDD